MKLVAWSAVSILLMASITEAGAQSRRAEAGPLNETADRDPNACTQAKEDDVVAPPVGKIRYIKIDCNLTLKSTDVVTKTLHLVGPPSSGVTVDCRGARIRGTGWPDKRAIVVESENGNPVENVTVRNCNVDGGVRVAGYAPGSDWDPERTKNIQAVSPKNIVFDGLTIRADGADAFYVFPGAMRVTLVNSRIIGWSNGVAIYLDAESAENVIKDNEIGVKTEGREQMSIDGSARNLIVGNRFSGLSNGGIFIYRNCGETPEGADRGRIRHQFPADNVILDNVFYYNTYRGPAPAVWIASRENSSRIGYCEDDNVPGAPKIGSNLDKLDHAHRTVVAQNRFIGRDLTGWAFVGNERVAIDTIKVDDDPSYVVDNVRDDRARNRESSCYVADGFPSPFVAHGKSVALFDDGSGPRCTGQRISCVDGVQRRSRANCESVARPRVVPFHCNADGSDRGCASRAACPRGTTVAAIKAACNLEYGLVTDEQISKTPWSLGGVVERSKDISEGVCVVGGVDVSERGAVLSAPRVGQVPFSCRERDDNGGDCHVRGALACAASRVLENATGLTR